MIKLIQLYFIALLLIYGNFINTSLIYSQEKKPDKKDEPQKKSIGSNFVFGGNIGLQIGTVTFIDISPNLGYFIKPNLIAGIGTTYQFYHQSYYNAKFSSSIYGGRIFCEYIIIQNIKKVLPVKSNFAVFSHLEYEALNLDHDLTNPQISNKVNRFWLHGILIGGGIRQPIGKYSSFDIAILININANSRTPYENPLIRIGFYF